MPEPTPVDCVVIGAGVVGLACARALAFLHQEVVILEQAASFGTETSSRHSEVIHAGIYYPQGSLKAQLCVEGKQRLYAYCQEKGIAHACLGKLIVATSPQQVAELKALHAFAAANGVPDLELLSQQEALSLEPQLRCEAALLSPSTGILDSHSYMAALLADAEAHGALLATHTRMLGARPAASSSSSSSSGSRFVIEAQDTSSGERTALAARWLVNAGGLHAQEVAHSLAPLGLAASAIPPRHLARGCYFSLSGVKAPFGRLVYPLPEPGGLGVHLTLDLGGQAKFGPDVEWVDALDYTVDPARAARFYPAVRSYWPGLPDGALQPSYAGIRPKISGPGQPAADFMLQGTQQHGISGLVNLFGIESPGLTSSLAIAERVAAMLQQGER